MAVAKRNILFPIETINRELDFRLFLAVMFASPERRIYIGQHDDLHHLLPLMHGGVYVGKNIFHTSPPADLRYYRLLKERGFSVVYLHEEGAFFFGEEDEWKARLDGQFDMQVFQQDDFICTWGRFQAEHCRERNAALTNNVRVTGHPRFDIYKAPYQEFYQAEARALRAELGKYVLLNTNVGLANHGRGLEFVFSERGGYKPLQVGSRMEHVGKWAHTSLFMIHVVPLLHNLADSFPDTTFVVRPHPSEDHSYYETVFSGVSNIQVRHDGPVGPWILGAEAVIHDGCTTAIEAYLAGKPIICFKPAEDSRYDQYVPNLVGTKCSTYEDVTHVISQVLQENVTQAMEEFPESALKLFYNFQHDAFPALLTVMEEAEAVCSASVKEPSPTALYTRHALRRANLGLRRPLYALLPNVRRRNAYHHTKFYGFDRNTISNKLDKIQQIVGKRIEHTQVSDSLILVDAT